MSERSIDRIQELEAENERLKAELAKYTWRKIESEKDLPEIDKHEGWMSRVVHATILEGGSDYRWVQDARMREDGFWVNNDNEIIAKGVETDVLEDRVIAYREAVPFEG